MTYTPTTARGWARVEEFTALRDRGLTIIEAGDQMGVCRDQAYRYERARLAAAGVERSGGDRTAAARAATSRAAAERRTAYRRLRESGVGVAEAGRRIGVARLTARDYEAEMRGRTRRRIADVEPQVLAILAEQPDVAHTPYGLAKAIGDPGALAMLARHLVKLAQRGVVVQVVTRVRGSVRPVRYSYRIAQAEAGAA